MAARPPTLTPTPLPIPTPEAADRIIAYPASGVPGVAGRDGIDGEPGPRGEQGPAGPSFTGVVLWTGQGTPPDTLPGSKAGDRWLDELTGDIYTLG